MGQRFARELEPGPWLSLKGDGLSSPQHNVELVPQRPFRLRALEVEAGDQAFASFLIGDRLKDRIKGKKRIARKIHLGNQPGRERRPQQRKMYVAGPPRIGVVLPGIGARLNGYKSVEAVRIREGAACPSEVGIKRSWVTVLDVQVASGGVGLPDLNQGVRNGA